MRKLVLDTSVLIALDYLELLWLPKRIASDVVIPHAVAVEAKGRAQSFTVLNANPQSIGIFLHGTPELDQGESEVLALCRTDSSLTAVIDELSARRVALTNGIPLLGTVSLLALGKKAGWISLIRPYLDTMQARGFRLSQSVIDKGLRLAGEA